MTALLDWLVGTNISLAALYILPMMAGAVVLRPFETAIFALVCSYLRSRFEHEGTLSEQVIRYVGDDDPDVALVVEVLVPELVAAAVWLRG